MAGVFDPNLSLGAMPPEARRAYLAEIDEDPSSASVTGQGLWRDKAWEHTGITVGFILDGGAADQIQDAFSLEADKSLQDSRIKITLNKFHVAEYPGMGRHRILCEFSGKNQIADESEELRFNLTGEANDGDDAGVVGKPIFMGLTVGKDGICFEARTVNVCNSSDDFILNVMKSGAFRDGLALASQLQPAIKQFAGLASGIVEMVLSRKKNVQIHTFSLGLDISQNSTSVRLRRGSYVVVQTDGSSWDWSRFRWQGGQIVDVEEGKGLHLNYMVFGVTSFEGPAAIAEAKPETKKAAG